MVALARPLLKGAADALLKTLGATTAAGGTIVVTDEMNKRAKNASESQDKAVAKTASVPTTRKACDKYPPDCGTLVQRNWNMSDVSREYQARITGFPPKEEWNFSGVDFDGFKSGDCLLQEAKARYDQFFDPDDGLPKWFFRTFGAKKIIIQAQKQSVIVFENPPSRLNWYFMQPLSFNYFAKQFIKTAPNIGTYLQQ